MSVEATRPRPARRTRAATPKQQQPKRVATPAPAPAPAPVVPTGPTNGYQATGTGMTRMPVPLRDTPQTVNVVTREVIQEQRLTTMEDALRGVPGITFSAGEGGQQGDSPIVRGFASRGDLFRDGVRDPGWYTRDLFSSDRVEVYKGPSGFAFGRGATGGAINTVSKLPTGETYIDGTLTGTTGPGVRGDLDVSGKVGGVAGRIAAVVQDYDTPDRDHVGTKRWGVAPSFSFDVTEKTKATFSYIYQGEESVPDYGRPYLPAPTYSNGKLTGGYYGDGRPTTPIPVPRDVWYGVAYGPLRDLVETETHILTGKIEHEFTKDIKVSNVTRYVSVDRMARPTAPRSLLQADNSTAVTPGYPVEDMTIGRQHFQTNTDNSLLVNQTDLVAKFDTAGLQHTLAVGAEFAREERSQIRGNMCTPTDINCRTSAWDPVDTNYAGTLTWALPNSTKADTAAVYASDQLKINEYFELMGAIRYDNFRTNYRTNIGGTGNTPETSFSRTDNLVSWRVGGVFHPWKNASIYASHGISYNPSAELATLDANTVDLDPEKTQTTEVGTKIDVLDGKLSLTAAIFRIEKTNMRTPRIDPDDPPTVLDGLARVDGFEIGIAGKLTDHWSVFAGYSYLDSEIVKSGTPAERGKELANTPPQSFSLWTTYEVTDKLTVGGGATYQDDTFANNTNTVYVPAFWKFDAMVAYKLTKEATLQLNLYNLTNELYYAQYYGGHAVPAPGRWGSLSLRMRF